VDVERLLISKVAHSGQIEKLMSAGVARDHFLDPEVGDIWEFLVTHVRKYRSAPSMPVVRQKFPQHGFEVVTDSIDYLTEQLFALFKRRHAIESLRALAAAVDDPAQILHIEERFLEESRRLAQAVPGSTVTKYSDMYSRIKDYHEQKKSGTHRGIMMGIPDFDTLTLGVQPHEYVSVVGWQGTGKSTLVQWMLFNAYGQGETPMLISLEMECAALFRKWDTMATNFEYHRLKALELPDADIRKWEEMAERVSKAPNDIIALDDVRGCTVDKVYAEVVKYQPSVVAVDYVSLMETQRSVGSSLWEKVTHITGNLKQVARVLKVPIIAVAQTNIESAEAGAQLQNIAYSRSIGQDSDIVLGLFCDDEMRKNEMMQVRLLKNRDGMTRYSDLKWSMGTMEFRPWNEALDLFNRP
jgi:replicative DNA helicase